MAIKSGTRRPSVAARRVGYVIAIVVNAVLLYLVNGRPGWQAVPFLTADMTRVLPLLNLSLIAGLAANVVFVVYDAPWCKSLGDLVTAGIGLAVAVRVWQVFPFAFAGSFDWSLPLRVLLVVAMVGTGVAMLVHAVSLVRGIAGRSAGAGSGHLRV
jgi:hypothetical protein